MRGCEVANIGCQKREDVVGRFAVLHLPDGGPARPDAGKESERPRFVKGKPDRRTGTESNKEVGAIPPKAMPVILTTREEIDLWLNAPAAQALKLQRPLPDNTLKIVARGEKKDEGGLAA